MPDFLNRMIIEAFKLPPNTLLKSIDTDEQGRYWLLSDGRLLSVCREQPRYKVFTDNGNGYYYVDINGDRQYLHRLLAITFNTSQKKAKIINNCIVHHLDRDKNNNKLDNLCIMTSEKHRAIHRIWNKIDNGVVVPWEQLNIEPFPISEQ